MCSVTSRSTTSSTYANDTSVGVDRSPQRQVDRARLLRDRRPLVEQLEHLAQRRARRLHRVVELAELLHRVEQVLQVERERRRRVPTVSTSRDESQPPTPMITAVPTTPAYSMIGKYHDEIFTVTRLARYCCSLVSSNRSVNEPSRPYACTTRMPSSPSWSVLMLVAMLSRTSRYALFDTLPEPAAREVDRRDDHGDDERELPAQQEDRDERADEDQHVLHEQHEALREQLARARRCRRSCARRAGRSSRSRRSPSTASSGAGTRACAGHEGTTRPSARSGGSPAGPSRARGTRAAR